MTRNELLWHSLELVLDSNMTVKRARHILGGSGMLAEFDFQLKEFSEITCGACTVAIGAHTNDINCNNGVQ